MPSNRAFTLLELLVVITIIGILSSIVIVSMSGSTDSATIAKGKAYAQQVHALLGHEAVLDLNFNENDYDTCPDGSDICDVSGYNNNGEIYKNEAIYVSSPIDGYALSFDGVDDYINIFDNSIFDVGGALTVEHWFKTITIQSGKGMVIHDSSDYKYLTYITTDSGVLSFYVRTVSGISSVSVSNENGFYADGEWHHLVGTFDKKLSSGRLKVYVDGIFIALVNAYNEDIMEGDEGIFIGMWKSDHCFNGLIDDVRIYAEALPATEIQKHYVQGLKNLLVNQAIGQAEYNQRMEEFNQSLVLYE